MAFFKITLPAVIPLFSTAFLMLGNGLYNTLIPLRLKAEGDLDVVIGIITSVFYLGMFIGSFNLSTVITRIGHIRAFAAFAAVLAISTIITGMKQNVSLWMVTRFIGGYSLAGLYITIESWMLNMSTNKTRGKYLALYMIILYGGQAGGQLFLNVSEYSTIMPFCIATILTMTAIVPISIMISSAPQIEEPQALNFKELYRISPTGVIGCVLSGVLLASIYGLLPVYFRNMGFNINDVAILMSLTIFGGVILQYPFGHLSDIIDRRLVLIGLCVVSFVSCIFMILFMQFFERQLMIFGVITFIFGGLLFSMYPISMTHACDYVKPNHIVEATQGMLLAYGIGSVIGPTTIAYFMKSFKNQGLFVSFACVVSCFAVYSIIRVIKSKKAIEATPQTMVYDTPTSPVSAELNPRSRESKSQESINTN